MQVRSQTEGILFHLPSQLRMQVEISLSHVCLPCLGAVCRQVAAPEFLLPGTKDVSGEQVPALVAPLALQSTGR